VNDYHINIFYSDDDGGYIADVPDLKACSAFWPTAEDALREVGLAKAAWLAAARAEGKPIPEPTDRPLIYQVTWAIPSGKPAISRRSSAATPPDNGVVPLPSMERG
jgi:predicted RNase H-like HicB family nuclease